MIYVMQAGERGAFKVGWVSENSVDAVEQRRKTLQTGCPHKLEVVAACPGDQAMEGLIHKHLGNQRTHGEWFYADAAAYSVDGERFGPADLLEWCGTVLGWAASDFDYKLRATQEKK